MNLTITYVIYRSLARDMHVPWKEYWKFVGDYADFTTSDGLLKLEEYLRRSEEKARAMEAKNGSTGIRYGRMLLLVVIAKFNNHFYYNCYLRYYQ